ncbi:MAG: hypothetical protein K2N54_09005 [Helicobacter sp.]|nr:hypothetical protein [Helicobacter sp.]
MKHFFRFSALLFSSRGTRGTTCEAFPLSPFNPQSLARFLKVCAPHGLCHVPQRFVYVMPCGSNIDVARCGWDY